MIGIDIGYKSIKIAEAVENKGKLEIRKLLNIPVPSEAYDNTQGQEIALNTKVLEGTLREARQQIKSARYVNYVFCNHQIITRDIEIDENSKEDMETAILERINQSLPGIVDTSVIDYRPKADGKIMICAAPEESLDLYCKTIYDSGFMIKAVDVECNSMRKLFSKYAGGNEAIGVIDIGHEKMDVSMFSKGELEVNRTFQCGSSKIDELISNFYNISHEEAEKIKISHFSSQDISEEDRERYLRFSFEGVLDEIKRMIQFVNSKNRDIQLQKIVLIGGGSLLPGIAEFFQSSLEISVGLFSLGSNITLRQQKDFNPKELPMFIPAISAVLREEVKHERH